RMYHFDALEDVVSTLDRLAQREPPLVKMLARQPGTKESRYMHLFSGEPAEANVEQASTPSAFVATSTADRISALEREVASLRSELSEVQRQLGSFRKQFE